MKKIISIVFFYFSILIFAQSNQQIDSLAIEFCKETKDYQEFTQSQSYEFIVKKIQELEKNNFIRDKSFYEKIYYRFYMNCPKAAFLLNQNMKKNNPESFNGISDFKYNLSNEKCAKIFENESFHYREIHTKKWVDTYRLDNSWTEFYFDGSSSNLKYEYNNDCKVKLTYISSNNELRKNAFFENDVFYYHLIDEEKDYYDFVIESPSNGEKYLMKFYKFKQ